MAPHSTLLRAVSESRTVSLSKGGSDRTAGAALGGLNVALGTSTFVTTSDGTRTAFLGVDSGLGLGIVGTVTNHDFILRTNNTERVRISASCSVTTTGSVTVGSGGSQAVNAGSYAVAGTTVIDSSKVIHGDVSGNLIRRFSQNTRPTLNTGEVAFWHRPSDGFIGLLFFDGTSYFWWAAPSDGSTAVKCFGNP